jgi:hypothetical protein
MATITISFAPHQAAMTSFLPLEKVRPIVWSRRLLSRAGGRIRWYALPTAQAVAEPLMAPTAGPTAEASTPASRPEADAGSVISIGTPATPATAPDG